MLATFNEYLWSFLTSGAQISYKTNTVGRSVHELNICRYLVHIIFLTFQETRQLVKT